MAARLLAVFEAAGAVRVEPGYLQPADVLLDLYGENIRARAYRTDDPVHGEQMLRPDFTVPVVRMHMEERREPARYTYAGPVWRRQGYGSSKAREFWQVGVEFFGDQDKAQADAEVFSVICNALGNAELRTQTGDLGFLLAGIAALKTTESRKVALRRHLWRPGRFQRLLLRFSGQVPFDSDTRDLPERVTNAGAALGMRTVSEIEARLAALQAEREAPDLAEEEVALMSTLLSISGGSEACLSGMRNLARQFGALVSPCDMMESRLEKLAAKGIDTQALAFAAEFGRASMEYYDGFVFAISDPEGKVELASGGRYDALTKVLGGGATTPAVGAVIRPATLLEIA